MNSFQSQLRRIRFLLRGSRLAGVALALAALVASLWLLFGIADFFGAFESAAMRLLTTSRLKAARIRGFFMDIGLLMDC